MFGITNSSNLILRFDDYHQNIDWDIWKNTLNEYNSRGLYGVIGVIPCHHGIEIDQKAVQYLKELEREGWEIAQHGYTHENIGEGSGGLLGDTRSEFAGLSYSQQYKRINKGKNILEDYGFELDTFIPPWHEYDNNTLLALEKLEFKCLNEGRWIWPRKVNGITCVPTHPPGITPELLAFGVVSLVSHPHLEDDPLYNAKLVSGHEDQLTTPRELAK